MIIKLDHESPSRGEIKKYLKPPTSYVYLRFIEVSDMKLLHPILGKSQFEWSMGLTKLFL